MLTPVSGSVMLTLPSKKTKVGPGTPKRNGVKTPNHGVFLCLTKIVVPLVRALSWWRAAGGRKAGRSPFPGSSNLLHVAAQSLEPLSGGSYIQEMEPSYGN